MKNYNSIFKKRKYKMNSINNYLNTIMTDYKNLGNTLFNLIINYTYLNNNENNDNNINLYKHYINLCFNKFNKNTVSHHNVLRAIYIITTILNTYKLYDLIDEKLDSSRCNNYILIEIDRQNLNILNNLYSNPFYRLTHIKIYYIDDNENKINIGYISINFTLYEYKPKFNIQNIQNFNYLSNSPSIFDTIRGFTTLSNMIIDSLKNYFTNDEIKEISYIPRNRNYYLNYFKEIEITENISNQSPKKEFRYKLNPNYSKYLTLDIRNQIDLQKINMDQSVETNEYVLENY